MLPGLYNKARRWRPKALRKYVYAVEAGHEKGRWHIHFVADARLLTLEDVSGLWRYGFVNPGKAEYPVLHAKGRLPLPGALLL